MYESFYGFRKKPFSLLPDPAFLYVDDTHRKNLAQLVAGVMNRSGLTLVTGEIGCGKTTLAHFLRNQLQDRMTLGLLTNTPRSFTDLLQWILHVFRVQVEDTSEVKLHKTFLDFVSREFAENRDTLLIVDEAQNLTAEQIEDLRLLTNMNMDEHMFQVILIGQPRLRAMLRQSDTQHFGQLIGVEYQLNPLELEQTEGYIRHRIAVAGGDPAIFDSRACEVIHQYCKGVPRVINTLCDTVLFFAYDEQKTSVEGPFVNKIVRDGGMARTAELEALQPLVLGGRSQFTEKRFYAPVPIEETQEGHLTVAMLDGTSMGYYKVNGNCISIGRSQDNDIRLPDEKVSRHHARVVSSQGSHYLEDLASANGTYVNAQRVMGYALQNRDVICIDKYRLNYSLDNDSNGAEDKTTSALFNDTETNLYDSVPQPDSYQFGGASATTPDHAYSTAMEELPPSIRKDTGKADLESMELPENNPDLDSILKGLSRSLD